MFETPKNHYGSRSQRGTLVAASYSLSESAKLHALYPRAYLIAATRAAIKTSGVITMPEDPQRPRQLKPHPNRPTETLPASDLPTGDGEEIRITAF